MDVSETWTWCWKSTILLLLGWADVLLSKTYADDLCHQTTSINYVVDHHILTSMPSIKGSPKLHILLPLVA